MTRVLAPRGALSWGMTFPDSATVRELVRLACLAPSLHNTQPWHWLMTGTDIQLHADRSRQLQHTDPQGRDLVISCGAALHQLTVAAAGHGWSCHIDRLPAAGRRSHLASISFSSHVADAMDSTLLRALRDRRTDRRQVSSWEVPPARLQQLTALAAGFGVLATVQPTGSDSLVRKLLTQAVHEQDQDEACQAELLTWIQPFSQHEGMPVSNLLTSAARERGDATRFPPGSLSDDHSEAAEPSPTWLILSTTSDDALSWLRVGEALDAIWLACTVAGLSVVPYSQPTEVQSTRHVLEHDVLNGSSCPQILLRLGWPPVLNEPVPPTPRRPLDEVLELPQPARRWRVREHSR